MARRASLEQRSQSEARARRQREEGAAVTGVEVAMYVEAVAFDGVTRTAEKPDDAREIQWAEAQADALVRQGLTLTSTPTPTITLTLTLAPTLTWP